MRQRRVGSTGLLAGCLLLAAGGLPGLQGCEQRSEDSPVLVIVNGEPITQREFDYRWASLPESTQERYRKEGGKRKFLDDLISREILLQEARKLGVDRRPEIRERLQQFKEQVLLDELVRTMIAGDLQVSEGELEAYIGQHAPGVSPTDRGTRERLRHELIASKHRQRYEEYLKKLRASASVRMADASKYVIQDAGRLSPTPSP